jgi:hypothetical protein
MDVDADLGFEWLGQVPYLDALERQRRDLSRLQELGFKDLYERFIEASGQYDALLAQAHSEVRPADWVERVESASREIQSAAESIRKYAGAKHPKYEKDHGI